MAHLLRDWLASTWLGRMSAATVAATTVFGASTVLESASAHADTVTYQVYNTDGQGLWLHPDSPTMDSSLSDLMSDGANFDISCWQYGDNVNGDAVWEYGTNEDTGNTGFAADFYLNTPTTQGNEASQLTAIGVPQCGSDSSSSNKAASPQPAASVPVFASYDRQAAENWALANAEDTPPNNGSCAWFVSHALWAGGLPKTSDWNDYWYDSHGFPTAVGGSGVRQGTVDAWGASNLAQYLSSQQYVTVEALGTMNSGNNDLPDARPGDVIGYIWSPPSNIASESLYDQLGHIDHLDVVTGSSASDPQYPLVSGWSEDGASAVNYNQRGWTYSAEHHTWLQWEQDKNGNYPNMHMVAYLIHITSEDDLNISNL